MGNIEGLRQLRLLGPWAHGEPMGPRIFSRSLRQAGGRGFRETIWGPAAPQWSSMGPIGGGEIFGVPGCAPCATEPWGALQTLASSGVVCGPNSENTGTSRIYFFLKSVPSLPTSSSIVGGT